MTITRRDFIKASAFATGGSMLGHMLVIAAPQSISIDEMDVLTRYARERLP